MQSAYEDRCLMGSDDLVHTPALGVSRPSQEEPLAQPTAPTCDGVLNEAQHCAWVFIDVEAEGIVFLWDIDDEVGVSIH